MSNVAIRVEGIGKRYRVGDRMRKRRRGHLLENVVESMRYPFRNLQRLQSLTRFEGEDGPDVFWALRDLSFEMREGEVLGVVGKNGAGKSTLLKVVSRITEPTRGYAEVRGRVGSLLEVGTGFHPELTGRENIYLNGSILGMSRSYIRRQFDEIVDFAGVERFIDTPVKRYSSGMYLRLAFAVAAHLEPEVLVIDEILAVGDAEFQRKCLGKMGEISRGGRTVLFVSHNLDAVRAICPRSILLEGGRLVADGPTSDIVRQYLETATPQVPGEWIDMERAERIGSGEVRLRAVRYTSHDPEVGGYPVPGGELEFTLDVASDANRRLGGVTVTISSLSGSNLVSADLVSTGESLPLREGRNLVSLKIRKLHLTPGRYRVSFWLADPLQAEGGVVYDSLDTVLDIEVIAKRAIALRQGTGGYVECEATFEATPARSAPPAGRPEAVAG
jgi:lipopolysaccharide transport system ATP-binding protein